MTIATLDSIYRYPVKGLSPELLPSVTLTPGETLPNDRRFAIENGPSGFDPAAPKYLPKAYFLMLMRNERLAALQTNYEDSTGVLTIKHNGTYVSGDLATPAGRSTIENFFRTEFTSELKGAPRLLEAPGHTFSDVSAKVVSIVNLASLAKLEDLVGQPVHPLRFRSNLYVKGWDAWQELTMLDRTIAIGDVRLKIVQSTVRCAAVNVDPETAQRDMQLPRTMMQRLGHDECGVYAEVITGGTITAGDTIKLEP